MIAVFPVKITFNLIVKVKYMKPKCVTFIQLCLQLIYCVVVFWGEGLDFKNTGGGFLNLKIVIGAIHSR